MAYPFSLPENYKIVTIAPTAAADSVTYDCISCKNALKVWFLIHHQGSNNTNMTLSLVEAQDVAATTNTTAVTATFPVWVNETAAASGDTLTREATEAASYVVDADAAANQLIVIEWDPAKFSEGYDCILLADTGGHASNNVTVMAIIATRYAQATPPAAITD